jgi:Ca2+-binding RTX toxin-like protein
MSVLNWVRFSQVVSWDQASAAATAAGGRLYIDDHDPTATQNWPQSLADVLEQSAHTAGLEFGRGGYAWFGISAITGGGYRWVDGRTVDPAWAAQRFGPPGDPNADADLDNDTAHLVILNDTWVSPQGSNGPFDIGGAFVEYASSRSVQGTRYSDVFFGGGGPGETLRAGAGNDGWIGTGGGKVYLGAGDDFASVRTLGFANDWIGDHVVPRTVIFDGPGRDFVDADTAVVRAAIDGDDDQFIAHRVSYADATGDLTVTAPPAPPNPGEPFFFLAAAGAGVGSDHFDASEIVGGSGNDRFEGVSRMQGGPGDDYLAPQVSRWTNHPYAQGDGGDDTLVAASAFRTELRGGAGDDVLLLSGPAEVSGGAGADRFVFRAAAPVTIVDFGPGDVLDLSRPTDRPAAELFAGGFLQVARSHGYTRVLFDPDGGGDDFSPLITLKGVFSRAALQDRIIGGSPDDPTITQAFFTAPIPAFQSIRIVSTDAAGAQGNGNSFNPHLSDDGRSVIFKSEASNLVAGDTNGVVDTFQKDLATGAITRIAEDTGYDPFEPRTAPGYLFRIAETGPDLGDFRNAIELIRQDLATNEEVLVSASANGTPANTVNAVEFFGSSADGRYVLFHSNADSLVPNDTNWTNTDTGPGARARDYFVKDLVTGAIINVSTDAAGNQIPFGGDTDGIRSADISADGRYVVFSGGAPNLVAGDTNGFDDIYLVDVQALRAGTSAAIAHVDIDNPTGGPLTVSIPKTQDYYAAQTTTSADPSVSAELPVQLLGGRSTALQLDVSGPAGEDAGAVLPILSTVAESAPVRVYEEAHGRNTRGESLDPQISSDGRYVVFTAELTPSQRTFEIEQVLRLDLTTGETTVVSTGANGVGNDDSFNPRISSDGRFVEFITAADNLGRHPNTTPSDFPQGSFYRKDLATGELTPISGYSLAETGQTANGVQVTFTTSRWIDTNRSNHHIQTQDLFVSHPDVIHSLVGGAGNELLLGGQFRDHLSGGDGRDVLRGGAGNDTLVGGRGDDQLMGEAGNDRVDGGAGADLFIFAQVTDGADTISGFTPGQDKLVFSAQMFAGGLAPGEVLVTAPQTDGNLLVAASDPFAASLNSSSAFLYDAEDGRLWFDPDGSGAQTAVLMATLTSAPALSSSDFLFA